VPGIVYLVCRDLVKGEADATAMGGIKNAAYTFAMPDYNRLTVVNRFVNVHRTHPVTYFYRGSDFDDPHQGPELARTLWDINKHDFEQFVADGYAEWLDDPALKPISAPTRAAAEEPTDAP
jgi:hypothetical protein